MGRPYKGRIKVAKAIGFVDDIAVLIRASNSVQLVQRRNYSFSRVRVDENRSPRITIRGTKIMPSKRVRYLGITLDDIGSFEHISTLVKNAEEKVSYEKCRKSRKPEKITAEWSGPINTTT